MGWVSSDRRQEKRPSVQIASLQNFTGQPYPTATSTLPFPPPPGPPSRLTHAYRPWAGNKHPCLGTRVPATPGLVSTQPIAG